MSMTTWEYRCEELVVSHRLEYGIGRYPVLSELGANGWHLAHAEKVRAIGRLTAEGKKIFELVNVVFKRPEHR